MKAVLCEIVDNRVNCILKDFLFLRLESELLTYLVLIQLLFQ